MKKLIFILSLIVLLQSCYSGAGAGFFGGSMLGGAIGGLVGGPHGRDLGIILGGAAGAAAGVAITESQNARTYSAYDNGYEEGYVSGCSSARSSASVGVRSRTIYTSSSSANQNLQSSQAQNVPTCPIILRNLCFVDDNNNHVINSDENGQIIFELTNSSKDTIIDVVPYVSELSGNEHVFLSPSERIAKMKPFETIRYKCNLKTDNKIFDGTMNFRIAVSSANTDFCTLREFTLLTSK